MTRQSGKGKKAPAAFPDGDREPLGREMERSNLIIAAALLLSLLLGCSPQESWVSGDTVQRDGGAGFGGGGGWSPTAGTGGWSPTAGTGGAGSGGAGSGGISGFDASVAGSGGAGGTDDASTGPTFQICADDAGLEGDAAAAAGCLVVGDLRAQVRFDGAVNDWIRPWFKIVNTGSTSYPLDGISLRYYYTVDSGSTAQTMDCWYAQIGCSSFSHAFVPVSGRELADHYLELSFTSGSVPAGGDTGDIQLGFHKSDWASYDDSNDWSYYPDASGYLDAETVPLYLNGTLIWGIEPPAAQ
jgi:hypothetical protein